MVFLSMAVHGIFSGQMPHWQAVMQLDELQVGMVEYVFFGCVSLGVAVLYLLRHIDYNTMFPAIFCAAVVAVVAGLLLNPHPTLGMIIACRAFNGLAAGVAMASVTPDLIAPVLLFSSTSVLVGSSLSSLFFEIFNSGTNLHASLDSTPTLILLLVPVFLASLSFIFFLVWFVRFFAGPLCPPADDAEAHAAPASPQSPTALDGSRLLHVGSAFTQGVVIGTILSTFPVLQTLDSAFFRPVGICHNAYLVVIMGKVTAQPASNMLSRTHPSLTASAGSLMLACGLLALTAASHTYASVVISLFAIGAGSSLLAFPAACLYSHHRAASAQRSYVTLAVVEFIGMYFLGVATVSCFASLKFSSIVVSAARRHRAPPSLSQRAGGHRLRPHHGDRCRFVFKNSERHVRARLLCRAVIYLLCCRGAAHALTRLARRCMTFAALYFMKSRAQQAKAS
jgi:hypothetical protein